jgi:GxxExxY protein
MRNEGAFGIWCRILRSYLSTFVRIELTFEGVIFEREKDMPIYYREIKVGSRRVDFFVGDLIMVELKAVAELEDLHVAQALNYLEAYNKQVGLLINIGNKSLTFKRLLNKKYRQ